jgi:hypothetical protein
VKSKVFVPSTNVALVRSLSIDAGWTVLQYPSRDFHLAVELKQLRDAVA